MTTHKRTAKREPAPLVRVGLLGDEGVGKSTLKAKLAAGRFDKTMARTLHTSIEMRRVTIANRVLNLQITDFSGKEHLAEHKAANIKDQNIYVIVFDASSKRSINNISKHVAFAKAHSTNPKFLLIANKSDLAINQERLVNRIALLNMPCLYVNAKDLNARSASQLLTSIGQIHLGCFKEFSLSQRIMNFLGEHWGKILFAGIMVGALGVLGVTAGGALPAMVAALAAIGLTNTLGAGLFALTAVAGVGLGLGMVVGAAAGVVSKWFRGVIARKECRAVNEADESTTAYLARKTNSTPGLTSHLSDRSAAAEERGRDKLYSVLPANVEALSNQSQVMRRQGRR